MQFPCLLAVVAFFSSTYGADLTIAPIDDVVVLPSQGDLLDSVSLSCRFRNAAVNIPMAHWVIQNGDGDKVIGIGINRSNYFAPLPIDGVMSLIISEVSYGHSGNYTCKAKNPGLLSTFVSATITLSLELELEVSFVVMNNTDSVEMRCEMSQYIEPDENLQWFRNGHMINTSNSKYQIQFEDGSTPSLINGVRTESRISVLVISDFDQQNDSGCYHCMTINTQKSQKSASIYVSLEEPAAGPTSCEEIETSKENSSVTTTPSDNPRPTTPGEDQENEERLLEGVPIVTIAVAATCAGLVLIFIATLLILMCYICCKTKQKTATNQSEYSNTIATINLWNDFSPPLPPRPNERIKRLSHTSDYYMNEGMGPDKQYTSISPYTSMASFPTHEHLQLPKTSMRGDRHESSYHVYDLPPEELEHKVNLPEDEYVCIPSHPAHNNEGNNVAFNGDNTSINDEYIQVSGGNDYINTFATGEGDEHDRTSNNEYVHIPDGIQYPTPHHYDNVPSIDDISRDDMTTSTSPDEPKADKGSTNPTYDRLFSQ